MIIDTDTTPGELVIRDAEAILGIANDLHLSPEQARVLADDLERRGEHTVAADGLRHAADHVERNT
ncbi:hypothetical protein [Mycolicibacterium goodii]|uniref:hypothetical protein n=1 Tax=Mycolicibacterium goodii TaxID=134601 RepID=UPI001BDC4032|nr:hypothetical protein [Mycolicibacterium goodii]MBU8838964.1 hypothetical protein [Mycolicibacterium goodii]